MGRSIVKTFRLRIGRDSDIIDALNNLSDGLSESDIVREALRFYYAFGNINQPIATHINNEIPNKITSFDFNSIEVKKQEKSEEQLESDLNNLLDNF